MTTHCIVLWTACKRLLLWVEWKAEGVIDGESEGGDCDEVTCADEVNQQDSEQKEVDGMKKGVDSTGLVMCKSGWWFVVRKINEKIHRVLCTVTTCCRGWVVTHAWPLKTYKISYLERATDDQGYICGSSLSGRRLSPTKVVVSCVLSVLPHQGRVLSDETTATMETGVLQLQVQSYGTAFGQPYIWDKLRRFKWLLNGYIFVEIAAHCD